MRREARKNDKKSLKGIWYLVGTAIGLAIIAFVVTFTMYGDKIEAQVKQAQLDNKKISEIVQNSETESASTQMGKTVEESEKEQNNTTNIVTNEANNESIKQDNKSAKTNTTTENKQETNKTDKKANDVTNTKSNEGNKETQNKTSKESNENKDNKTNTNTTSNEKANNKKELTFTKPVDGDILKSFAKDTLIYSETLGEWATHLGIDIKADKTTVVKASADGKIKSIKNDPRYGLSIIIEHDNGYETLYSNLLSTEFVKVGEEVKQGQSIGTVGNTATFEIADPSHLHFEIIKNGVQQDPNVVMSN